MRRLLLLFVGLTVTLFSPGVRADEPAPKFPKPTILWEATEGLQQPESAFFDEGTGTFFVSNVAGEPAKKDGVGWISQLDKNGKVLKAKWVDGLNAPKGLRAHDGKLWVTDIDQVVQMDIATAKIDARIPIEGAQFLNDLAIGPDGTVYVTDMFASKIYAIADGKPALFAEGPELENPNGVLVDGDALVLAGWGTVGDATPKTPGRLYKLDLKTKKKTLLTKEPTGNLDGVERDGEGGYIVTDWVAGKVLRVAQDGTVTTLIQHDKGGTADHAYFPETKTLIVPLMLDNKVVAYDLSK
jgi:sugar lactone lactonase YvrE